jgi:hypothetical protein
MLFHQVQGAVCILRSKGVFKQVDVFVYGKRLFAKWGGGFIGLKAHSNGTTLPSVTWEHIEGVAYEIENFDLVQASSQRKAA